MKFFSKSKIVLFLMAAVVGLMGCNNSPTTTTVNGNQANISNVPVVGNVNVVTNTNTNSTAVMGDGTGIEAREPDQYQATVTLKLETGTTDKSTALAPLTAQVARMGGNKRMEFALPGGEKVIYLERDGKQFVISPQRKQYAELNREALGVDPKSLLTPEQIIKKVRNIKGVERVGEEKFGDRDVIKYRYNSTTKVAAQPAANTQTTTDVSTDAVVLVDKETGLPLRSETFAESQNNAVAGVKSVRIVTEMTNVQMTADPKLFDEPTDFKKVPPEEIRAQADMIFRTLGALLTQVLNSQQGGGSNQPPTVNSPTPAAKP